MLQRAGLIHYTRGKVKVLDRPGLEERILRVLRGHTQELRTPDGQLRNVGPFARSEVARDFFGKGDSMTDSEFRFPESTPVGDRGAVASKRTRHCAR